MEKKVKSNISHKITTVEKINVKEALVKDDLTLLIDGEDEPIVISDFFKRFTGKIVTFSLSEKTEEEIEDDYVNEDDSEE